MMSRPIHRFKNRTRMGIAYTWCGLIAGRKGVIAEGWTDKAGNMVETPATCIKCRAMSTEAAITDEAKTMLRAEAKRLAKAKGKAAQPPVLPAVLPSAKPLSQAQPQDLKVAAQPYLRRLAAQIKDAQDIATLFSLIQSAIGLDAMHNFEMLIEKYVSRSIFAATDAIRKPSDKPDHRHHH